MAWTPFAVVHDLRDVEVDGRRSPARARGCAPRPVLALHQVEHRLQGQVGGDVEIVVEPERDPTHRPCAPPAIRRSRSRRTVHGQPRLRDRRLDRGAGHLAVALAPAWASPAESKRAVDLDR